MAYVNVAEWNPEHVADWLRGLEDEIQPYTQFFVNNKVNGCQLLTLARDDLTNLNMTKIGHQELVLEAVELLRQLHYNLTSETLQSLALKLGCKAQSLFNDLKRVCQDFADTGKKERVSAETLSAVSDIINLVKSLISWLDRYPFVGQESYVDVRKTILKLSVELASTAQRDQFAENPHKIIKETCLKLAAQSDKIVQEFNDSLIIQPASLEVAKIKRKADDDLGIHINSLYTGIHIIEDIKFQSPAYRSGKVEEGDEIVQVNYQTVIGWQIRNIICAMKEHPSEVHLTLKKRPRHPNVLGQVITLWPYRIPSKKTAFRKLYKWNKGKDIRDLCPKSPGTRGESNSVSEVNGGLIADKEKLFAINKPRNRLRRRATVTGVSPTTLQAPVSLEELIGSNSRRKESVLRTISYDPNKTVDLEDNVFKRETQTGDQDGKQECELKTQETFEVIENEPIVPKSPFLRPPQEKYMTGHLKRQEALKNSETVARAGVAKPSPLSIIQNAPPPKPPLRPPMQQQNATTDASIVQDTAPSGSQSPKSKLADWVNRQKKKPEVGLLQHALTLFSQDSNATPPSPGAKDSGSPQSPKCNTGSPKAKKTSANMFQFPFREGRPSLSELRGLKRAANSRVFSERVSSTQVDKPPTSPKHNSVHKRSQMTGKKPGLAAKPTKEPKLNHCTNGDSLKYKDIPKLPDNYIHPKFINYAKIPQYPYEMHESKIVSLRARANNNLPRVNNETNTQTLPTQPRNNLHHYQRVRQMSKMTSEGQSTLIRSRNPDYPKAFYSPSGRSLSFNNLVVHSDDESSSEEYEIYEELCDDSLPLKQEPVHNIPPAYSEMDPNFTRQVAEVYNMLTQRQQFLQSQMNNGYRGQMNVPNAAVIDELALRMYHALRMNHMKTQNAYQPQQPTARVPELKNTAALKNIAMRSTVAPNKPQRRNCYPVPQPKPQSYPHSNEFVPEKNGMNSVTEHPVDLPPSAYLPSRNGNHVFKSATSQQIHNLYTSRTSNKGSVSNSFDGEKNGSFPDEQIEKDHTYETIPYQKSKCIDDIQVDKCDEKIFLYPAEKEFEHELPCKDSDVTDNRLPERNVQITANPNFKTIQDNVFCPIKEDISLKSHHFDNCSAFKPVAINHDKNKQICNKTSQMNCNGNDENQVNNFINMYDKNIQPAISSLIMNIPKPPSEAYSPTATKCSSSQTDSELCDSVDVIEEEKQPVYFTNDESFNSLNCTDNSVNESHNFSSSSSLNSSSSGSTISSSGSCYYYVETQIKPQFTIKYPSATPENGEEDTPLIDLRSPTLPTMGVSMLSKKRSSSSSGSEHGSNAGSRASPNVAVIAESDATKTARIVTDVEHTI